MINRNELLDSYIQMCEQIKQDKSRSEKERAEYSYLHKWLISYRYLKNEKESKYGIAEYSLHLDDIVIKSEDEGIIREIAECFKEKDSYNTISLIESTSNKYMCGGFIQIIKNNNTCKKDTQKIKETISIKTEVAHNDVDVNEIKEELLKIYNYEKTVTWI